MIRYENHPDNEIKLPRVMNIKTTFIPSSYPPNALTWMLEFNYMKKFYNPKNNKNGK